MKKPSNSLAGTGLALALGLSGCGTDHAATRAAEPPPQPPASRQELLQSVRASLQHLEGLQLFTVGDLVLKLPEHARDCYGVPCPGDTASQTAYDAELTRQAARLASFVKVADMCNSGHCYLARPQSADETLAALNALEVVHVQALVTVEPKNDPSCNGLVCPEEEAAARAENERREVLALTIAHNAKGL
ncbi:MAG: hypothetical protein U0228_37085 [Myxococcaceae bacterium]